MQFRPYPQGVGTYVIFAGAESNHFRRFLTSNGAKGILFSFYYLRKWLRTGEVTMDDLKTDAMKAEFLFIDSGGFTLQLAVKKGQLDVDIPTYIREYYDFAEQMLGYAQVFGAVDCVSDSYTWSDMIAANYAGYDRGIHIAPTVFGDETIHEIQDTGYLSNFDMIALSAPKKKQRQAMSLFQKLRGAGMKIHGYAKTSQEEFRGFDFFSVDSSTWLGGQKYGTTYIWRGGKMRTYGYEYKKRIRPTLKQQCLENDINFDKIMTDEFIGAKSAKRAESLSQDVLDEINKMNLLAWKSLVDYNLSIVNRAYWLKQQAPTIIDTKTGKVVMNNRNADDLLSTLNVSRTPPETPPVAPESTSPPNVEPIDVELNTPLKTSDSATSIAVENNEVSPFHKKVPLQCDTCNIANDCLRVKPNASCSYHFDELFELSEGYPLQDSAKHLIELQFDRVQRAALFEKTMGGALDAQLSQELSRYFTMLQSLKGLGETTSKVTISATGRAATEGSKEGGLLSNLLKQ